MRKTRIILAIAAIALVSCTVSELGNETDTIRPKGDVYTAFFEQTDTKVYVDGNLNTLWTEGDEISIFTTTYNQHYKFDGNTGDDNGSFSEVSSSFFSGGSVPTVYAIYPYSENTSITSEGVITLDLPAVQNYAENSYGLGANTMVAVTENKTDKALFFKSLSGYVVVRLYGYATIKSITLTGNNGEKISGQATVAPIYGQAPSVVMSESAGTSITLDCGEGVELGKTADDATAFWFAVPPVTFTQGFTIRVTNIDGYSMEKTTHVERTVVRNIKNPLSVLEVTGFPIAPEGNIVFEDANFKAYCVEHFDKNGDGEVSFKEASYVLTIQCNNLDITSLEGIQYFTMLKQLTCHHNKLSSLDVSQNIALESLSCQYNQLLSLNVSKNMFLTKLSCFSNQLSSLDIKNNIALKELHCHSNQIDKLDVSNSLELSSLDCSNNYLASLDISNNNSLIYLQCSVNQLTSLEVNRNLNLESLLCYSNQLTSLNVRHNTTLRYFDCNSNHLTSLDVSQNTLLETLSCQYNQLLSLDISKNKALTRLYCDYCNLSSLTVADNISLKSLSCASNQLSLLDVSHNIELQYLGCHDNYITELNIDNNTELTRLICASNQLSTINISKNTILKEMNCEDNQISFLDLSNNTALTKIRCSYNYLISLNVSECAELETLFCHHNPNLIEIWLKTGQTISNFQYDTSIATIYYRD